MPPNKSVQAGLELIKKDPSKVLGLTIGKHNITEPGQYVPRAGESLTSGHVPPSLQLDHPPPLPPSQPSAVVTSLMTMSSLPSVQQMPNPHPNSPSLAPHRPKATS